MIICEETEEFRLEDDKIFFFNFVIFLFCIVILVFKVVCKIMLYYLVIFFIIYKLWLLLL